MYTWNEVEMTRSKWKLWIYLLNDQNGSLRVNLEFYMKIMWIGVNGGNIIIHMVVGVNNTYVGLFDSEIMQISEW